MAGNYNKHGLSRHIPKSVALEVRQRCKFGCVVCRSGFYQLEHFEPAFKDAVRHDPDGICCLCGKCHDYVTRGAHSKAYVKKHYHAIMERDAREVGPPHGPLDFHDGRASLVFGGIKFDAFVKCVLRYHGAALIYLSPGTSDTGGSLSAVFTDDEGRPNLRLIENMWVGEMSNWDIEITANRIKVRRRKKEVNLQLRLDPPGKVVIEKLDMRFRSAHLLATENNYVVGRYLNDNSILWVTAKVEILHSLNDSGSVIEFMDLESMEVRDLLFGDTCADFRTSDSSIITNAIAGIMVKPAGIGIATYCGKFREYGMAIGNRAIDDVRKVIFSKPDCLCNFIGTGEMRC